jgi:hypothetical protein
MLPKLFNNSTDKTLKDVQSDLIYQLLDKEAVIEAAEVASVVEVIVAGVVAVASVVEVSWGW